MFIYDTLTLTFPVNNNCINAFFFSFCCSSSFSKNSTSWSTVESIFAIAACSLTSFGNFINTSLKSFKESVYLVAPVARLEN